MRLLVCNDEWDVFLARFGPHCTIWASLQCNTLRQFCCWWPAYPSAMYFQQKKKKSHNAHRRRQLAHCTPTAFAVTRLQSNRPLTHEDSLQHLCDAIRSTGTGYWPNLPLGLWEVGPLGHLLDQWKVERMPCSQSHYGAKPMKCVKYT